MRFPMVDTDAALDPTAVAGGIEVHPEYVPGETGERRAVVRLWGEIDHTLRPDASEAMMALLGHDGPVVADLSDLTFIDSAGLAFLLQLQRWCADGGHRLVLADPPVLLLDLLDAVGAADSVDLEFRPGTLAD